MCLKMPTPSPSVSGKAFAFLLCFLFRYSRSLFFFGRTLLRLKVNICTAGRQGFGRDCGTHCCYVVSFHLPGRMLDLLNSLATDVCGPEGRCTLFRSSQCSGVTINSAASRLLDEFVEFPLLRFVLKNTASAQEESLGEGSVLATIMASNLIRLTLLHVPLNVTSRALTAEVFQRCLNWCLEVLQPVTSSRYTLPALAWSPLSPARMLTWSSLVRSLFSSKPVAVPDASTANALAVRVVKTLPLAVAETISKFDARNLCTRVLQVIGSDHEVSRCVEGIIINRQLNERVSDWLETGSHAEGRVLVFTDSLEVPSVSGSNPAVDSNPARATECNVSIRSEWSAFLKRERMIATAVVDSCCRLGVKVVFSQCVMNNHLQERLLRAGVLPIDRLSAIHIDTLACLTRAKPLNSSMLLTMQHDEGGSISESCAAFAQDLSSSLGVCGKISSVRLGGKIFPHVRPPSEGPDAHVMAQTGQNSIPNENKPKSLRTLILCAPSDFELRELNCAVQSASKVSCWNFL